MTFPEVRVTRRGPIVDRVVWDPVNGKPVFDLTGMNVTRVDSVIRPTRSPEVTVTFQARLVELDSE